MYLAPVDLTTQNCKGFCSSISVLLTQCVSTTSPLTSGSLRPFLRPSESNLRSFLTEDFVTINLVRCRHTNETRVTIHERYLSD